MKRVIVLIVSAILCIVPVLSMGENIDLSSMTQEELLALIDAAKNQLNTSEPVMVEKAIEMIKAVWLEDYKAANLSKNGFLEILNTRIVYVKEEIATQDVSDKNTSMFQNVYCVIEFTLLSDYYGSGPYYEDVRVNDSVVVYRDGSVSVEKKSPFGQYRSKTYEMDLSKIIESIHDLGSEYNAVFELLNEGSD